MTHFWLVRSQDVKLSNDGLQAWMDISLVKVVIWKLIIETKKTSDYNVGGGFDSHLPTMLDC